MKSEKGAALVLTLAVLVALSILAVALITLSAGEQKQSLTEENRIKAYYAARSGADAVASSLITNAGNARNQLDVTNPSTVTGVLGDGRFSAGVTKSTIDGSVWIETTGTVKGVQSKAMLKVSKLSAMQVFANAVTANSSSTLDLASVNVYNYDGSTPTIVSNGMITPNTSFSWNLVPNAGNYFAPFTFNKPAASAPNFTGGAISTNCEFNKISLNNQSLVFNTPTGSAINVFVNDFSTKGDIYINGSGVLNLYIKNSANFQTPNLYNNDPKRFFIYLHDGCTCSLNANGTFSGFIYGPYANISMESSQTNLTGSVIGYVLTHNSHPTITFIPLPASAVIDSSIVLFKREYWN